MELEENKKVINFLEGNPTKKDWIELKEWLKNTDNKKELEEYEGIWNATEIIKNKRNLNIDDSWEKLENKLNFKSKNKVKFLNLPIVKIAAIIIISFGLGIFINSITTNYKAGLISEINTKISTPLGSKTNLTLPDGSKVWLNSVSSIQYSNNFIQNTREVTIEGEAYFEVTKNKNIPFIVQTSHINIKVHGTSFNVKSFKNDNIIEATLVEGSIEILGKTRKSGKSIFLEPNYKACYNKENNKLQVKNVESEIALYTAWRNNQLIFKNEPLESLILKLERWYGLNIEVKNSDLLQLRFSGSFTNETAEQAINALKLSSNFEYSIVKNKVNIY